MASVVNNTYTLASGRTNLILGQVLGPSWSTDLVTGQWKSISGTGFTTNITPLVPAATGNDYWGSNKVDGVLDAYCDPIPDLTNENLYYFGGGHTNSSNNGVYKLNLNTMQYSMVLAPTDPKFYPPSYSGGWVPNISVIYPSGLKLGSGYFGISSELPLPQDNTYAAPWRAPNSQHTYAALQMGSDGKIRCFYGRYMEFDTATNAWTFLNADIIGPALYAFDTKYGNEPLGEFTTAVYHPGTNRYLFTLQPGSTGNNWRHGIVIWNPVNNTIVNLLQGEPYSSGTATMCVAGQWVYSFSTAGITDTVNGWRYNMVTGVRDWITVQGDTFASGSSTNIEGFPLCYHPVRGTILRWAYNSDINALYEVNLTPTGGGDGQSPSTRKIFQQTRIPITGTGPTGAVLNYQRMYYHSAANAIVFQPSASQNVFALRI